MEEVPITSCWQSRQETPDQLAQRLRTLLRLLRPVSPLFQDWFHVVDEKTFRPVDETSEWLAEDIAAHITRDELRFPSPRFGYRTLTMNALPPDIQNNSVGIHLHGGGEFINSLNIYSLGRAKPDLAFVDYSIFKAAVLAVAQAFDPDYCEAGPFSLWKNMDLSGYLNGPIMTPTWMIHLSPPLAELVAPPMDVISERGTNGSLFMAATDQPFSGENPAHVAAAQRIHDVVDQLHAVVPFNGRMRR